MAASQATSTVCISGLVGRQPKSDLWIADVDAVRRRQRAAHGAQYEGRWVGTLWRGRRPKQRRRRLRCSGRLGSSAHQQRSANLCGNQRLSRME